MDSIRTRKHKYTVASEYGTFTRTTGRTYTHVVIGRNVGMYRSEGGWDLQLVPVTDSTFGVLGWAGRLDLAHKLAAHYRSHPNLWTDVRVLDVATGKEVAL